MSTFVGYYVNILLCGVNLSNIYYLIFTSNILNILLLISWCKMYVNILLYQNLGFVYILNYPLILPLYRFMCYKWGKK